MMDLSDLYQELILDHSRSPRNFGRLATFNMTQQGFNPVCGDQVTFYILESKGVIQDISFEGEGCAIAMASASLLTDVLKGKSVEQMHHLFDDFTQVVTTGEVDEAVEARLQKLIVLAGVSQYPVRVKCATLAWHTVKAAVSDEDIVATTE